MKSRKCHKRASFLIAAALTAGIAESMTAVAAPITWVGANNDWVDGAANNANWSPADEPDFDDIAFFNASNSVNLGSNNLVMGLTMSNGIDLNTNGLSLTVDGLVQLTGSSTNLFIGGAGSVLDADNVTINSGAAMELTGGTLVVNEEDLFASGILTINLGGTLAGHEAINLADAPLVPGTLFNNNGARARSSLSSRRPWERSRSAAAARRGRSSSITVNPAVTVQINRRRSTPTATKPPRMS